MIPNQASVKLLVVTYYVLDLNFDSIIRYVDQHSFLHSSKIHVSLEAVLLIINNVEVVRLLLILLFLFFGTLVQ